MVEPADHALSRATLGRLCAAGLFAYSSDSICRVPLLPLFAHELGVVLRFLHGSATAIFGDDSHDKRGEVNRSTVIRPRAPRMPVRRGLPQLFFRHAEKYLIADVDTYRKGPEDDIYAGHPINYVKLDRLPGPADDWTPILQSIRNGDFWVSTGEILWRLGGQRGLHAAILAQRAGGPSTTAGRTILMGPASSSTQ